MLCPAYFSILDIAYRWHALAVPSSPRNPLPPVVLITTAMLLRAIVDGRLAVYESPGITSPALGSEMSHVDELDEAPLALAVMSTSGRYDPTVLAHYRLCVDELYVWAVGEGFAPPASCKPSWHFEQRVTRAQRQTPRTEADDKRACQTIAKHRWTEDDHIGMAAMVRDNVIQVEGNGRLYRDATVRRWLSAVAPMAVRGARRARHSDSSPRSHAA